jgi:hypothetical protein
MGIHGINLRQLSRDRLGLSAGGNDMNFFAKKLFRSDASKDFAYQAAITEHSAGQHRLNCRSADSTRRLFRRELRQESRALIKKIVIASNPAAITLPMEVQ